MLDASATPLAGRAVGFTERGKWDDLRDGPAQQTARSLEDGRFELRVPRTTGSIHICDAGWRTVLAPIVDGASDDDGAFVIPDACFIEGAHLSASRPGRPDQDPARGQEGPAPRSPRAHGGRTLARPRGPPARRRAAVHRGPCGRRRRGGRGWRPRVGARRRVRRAGEAEAGGLDLNLVAGRVNEITR